MLTAEEVAHYNETGQVTPRYRLGDDDIAAIKDKMEALFAAQPGLDQDYVPGLIEMDRSWLDVAARTDILDAIGQLIGDDIVVWGSALFCKKGTGGKATPWHQDGKYWPIRPLATCTAWIAIDHSTPENGCLRIVPGSHKSRELFVHETDESDQIVLHQAMSEAHMPAADPVDVILEPGMISFHDVYVVHGAEPNNSGARRGGLTFRYMPTTSHFDRELAARQAQEPGIVDITKRQLHLVRGTDRCGKNDVYAPAAEPAAE